MLRFGKNFLEIRYGALGIVYELLSSVPIRPYSLITNDYELWTNSYPMPDSPYPIPDAPFLIPASVPREYQKNPG